MQLQIRSSDLVFCFPVPHRRTRGTELRLLRYKQGRSLTFWTTWQSLPCGTKTWWTFLSSTSWIVMAMAKRRIKSSSVRKVVELSPHVSQCPLLLRGIDPHPIVVQRHGLTCVCISFFCAWYAVLCFPEITDGEREFLRRPTHLGGPD